MTALKNLIHLEQDVRDFGFVWPNVKMVIDQTISECREVEDAISKQEPLERIQEEMGDLLHASISLCLFLGFDVEETLAKVHQKFAHRMSALKQKTQERGLSDLQGQDLEFMTVLWKEIKDAESKNV